MAFSYRKEPTELNKRFRGSETTARSFLTSLRDEAEPRHGPRRRFLPLSVVQRKQQPLVISSRRATWLVLCKSEELSQEDLRNGELVLQAHPKITTACLLARAFAKMVRDKHAAALEPWLKQAKVLGVPELLSFAAWIRPLCSCSDLHLESRSGSRADPSSQAAQTPILRMS